MKNIKLLLIVFSVFLLNSCNKKERVNNMSTKIEKKDSANFQFNTQDSANQNDSINNDKPESSTKKEDDISSIDVVFEILESSQSYKEKTNGLHEAIKKNGGTSFGITVEGSPNPEKDNAMKYSENYDLALHETYPDRNVTIKRYTFDPKKRQLFLYDVVEDDLKPINFDKKLLVKFDKVCK